jgi:CRP-like cAMP-binding protein
MTDSLDRFSLLSELVPDDRRALAAFLEPRELDASSTLFRASDEAEELYFVVDGALSVRSAGETLGELGAGEVLGALCLVAVGRRECDAVAITTSKLLCLSREAYLRMRGDAPALALQLQEAVLRSFSSLVRGALSDGSAHSVGVS